MNSETLAALLARAADTLAVPLDFPDDAEMAAAEAAAAIDRLSRALDQLDENGRAPASLVIRVRDAVRNLASAMEALRALDDAAWREALAAEGRMFARAATSAAERRRRLHG
ncbi:hypothetical protein MWN33_02225 [Starkeya koreensis]|uniref:Uncharacterized protein n=1 Tax=Ancylobacter koreensis TaxID=266121 RepID=A0ABT0DHS9_9HYPH|nr:hypothetical protein [Ancylobacter koreensis]MCK0206843.1 hypothetical protein [Ancylobacter koreensis]